MKKTIFFLFTALFFGSCAKNADSYKPLVDEYKTVMCTALDSTSSLSEKAKAQSRQVELNQELQEAMSKLELEELSKLTSMMNIAMAEASEGKCNK